jgi:hypothetical protein
VEWKATLDLKELSRMVPAVRLQAMERLAEQQETLRMEGMLRMKQKELDQLRYFLDRTREELERQSKKIEKI